MIQVTPLHADFAAEVSEVDITHLDQVAAAELRKAFARYAVLLLRGQDNATRRHLDSFAALFGTPSGCSDITNLNEDDSIMDPESLDARYTRGNSLWHMDMLVLTRPPLAAILLARELPTSGGGATQFADLASVWKRMPKERQRDLRKLHAVHTMETIRTKMGITDPAELRSEYASGKHPLVCVDPHSGEPTFFFSAHTSHVIGMPEEAGAALIAELEESATADSNVYTHLWRPHDLLIWSNRRAMHRVLPYDFRRKRRRLWRIEVVSGDRPAPIRSWWSALLG